MLEVGGAFFLRQCVFPLVGMDGWLRFVSPMSFYLFLIDFFIRLVASLSSTASMRPCPMDTSCVLVHRTTPEASASGYGTVPTPLPPCFSLDCMPPLSGSVPRSYRSGMPPFLPLSFSMPSVRFDPRFLSIGTGLLFERDEPSDGMERGFGRRRWR